jgi:hypothetical protein
VPRKDRIDNMGDNRCGIPKLGKHERNRTQYSRVLKA